MLLFLALLCIIRKDPNLSLDIVAYAKISYDIRKVDADQSKKSTHSLEYCARHSSQSMPRLGGMNWDSSSHFLLPFSTYIDQSM